MKTFRQVCRQAFKSLVGIMLMGFAGMVLCICVEQAAAAKNVEKQMDENFASEAVLSLRYLSNRETVEQVYPDGTVSSYIEVTYFHSLSDEVNDWIENLPGNYPQWVEKILTPGLASAYIPTCSYSNASLHDSMEGDLVYEYLKPADHVYNGAMFEIELTEIRDTDFYRRELENLVQIQLEGKILSVVALEPGFRDFTGWYAYINLQMPSQEALDALHLTVGERYLVSGTNITNLERILRQDWELKYKRKYTEELNRENIEPLGEYYTRQYREAGMTVYTYGYYRYGNSQLELSNITVDYVNGVSLQCGDLASIAPEGGTYYLKDAKGTKTPCTAEEYQALYSVPTIAHLTGSVEEFLAEEPQWQTQLELLEKNYHNFPVLGIDRGISLADFATENSYIAQGRDFTQAERENGEAVCLISENFAQQNQLNLGDTLTLQYSQYDWSNPYQSSIRDGHGIAYPGAWLITRNTRLQPAKEYTIVGIYHQNDAWAKTLNNLYGLWPETILVPQASVTGSMDYGTIGMFRTVQLKNGSLREFQQAMIEAGYEGLFYYYDQGYTQVAGSLADYNQVAKRAAGMGIGLFAGILLLFTLLYPMQQKKTLSTMWSLGASRWEMVRQVLLSSLWILLPGAIVGIALGAAGWQRVLAALMESAGTNVELHLNPVRFAAIGLGQLIPGLGCSALTGWLLTRNMSMRKGR